MAIPLPCLTLQCSKIMDIDHDIWLSVSNKIIHLKYMVVHAFNSRTLEIEAGKSLVVQGHAGLHSKLPAIQSYIVRACLKKKLYFFGG